MRSEQKRVVKIADIEHIMDLSRLKFVTNVDKKRCAKYEKALAVLKY